MTVEGGDKSSDLLCVSCGFLQQHGYLFFLRAHVPTTMLYSYIHYIYHIHYIRLHHMSVLHLIGWMGYILDRIVFTSATGCSVCIGLHCHWHCDRIVNDSRFFIVRFSDGMSHSQRGLDGYDTIWLVRRVRQVSRGTYGSNNFPAMKI